MRKQGQTDHKTASDRQNDKKGKNTSIRAEKIHIYLDKIEERKLYGK